MSEEHRSEQHPTTPGSRFTRPEARRVILIERVLPGTVFKIAFLISCAVAVMSMVALTLLWTALSATGVWRALEGTIAQLVDTEAAAIDLSYFTSFSMVFTIAIVIALMEVVLIPTISWLFAVIYNVLARAFGGIAMTMAPKKQQSRIRERT